MYEVDGEGGKRYRDAYEYKSRRRLRGYMGYV